MPLLVIHWQNEDWNIMSTQFSGGALCRESNCLTFALTLCLDWISLLASVNPPTAATVLPRRRPTFQANRGERRKMDFFLGAFPFKKQCLRVGVASPYSAGGNYI